MPHINRTVPRLTQMCYHIQRKIWQAIFKRVSIGRTNHVNHPRRPAQLCAGARKIYSRLIAAVLSKRRLTESHFYHSSRVSILPGHLFLKIIQPVYPSCFRLHEGGNRHPREAISAACRYVCVFTSEKPGVRAGLKGWHHATAWS
jgi:hypothetical protein